MTLLDFARLTRLPNVFTAMADICLAWLAIDTGMEHADCFLLLLLSSSSLYLGGMVWNDYFDVEQDMKERPGRPLASGRVPLSSAFWLGSFFLVIGVVLAGLADWRRVTLVEVDGEMIATRGFKSVILALLLVLAILGYDGWLKRTWAGPIAMGSCRFLNIMLGLSVVPGFPPAWGWMLALVIGMYITGVTWFAWTEARVSSAAALRGASFIMLAAVLLSLAVPALVRQVDLDGLSEQVQNALWWRKVGMALFPFLLVVYIFAVASPVLKAIANPAPERVQAAVKRTILGLVLLDAVLATALAGPVGLAILLLLLPARFLGRWVYST